VIARTCLVEPGEALEDSDTLIGWDARPIVFDVENDRLRSCLQAHPTTGDGMSGSIVEQVIDHPGKLI